MRDFRSPNGCVKCLPPMRRGGGRGAPFNYKSPRKVGVVVKALEGCKERQGLDLRIDTSGQPPYQKKGDFY